MSQFKSTEHYQQFISAWKSATNSEKAKSKKVVCDFKEWHWNGISDAQKERYEAKGFTVNDDTVSKKDGSHCKEPGWLDAEHYLFYNMKKGKTPKFGFAPITAMRKLEPGDTVWRGFNSASWALHFVVRDAIQHIEAVEAGKKPNSGARAKKFLEPFNGAVTIADLIDIDLDALEQARKVHR